MKTTTSKRKAGPAAAAPPPAPATGGAIAEATQCIEISLRAPLFRRQMSSEDIINSEETDPNFIRVSKDLVNQKELRALRELDRKFREWLKLRTVPSPMLRRGMYLVPASLVEAVEGRLDALRAEREAQVLAFAGKYDELKKEAAERLGPHFDAGDYPPLDSVVAAFSVEVRYRNLDVPGTLGRISKDLVERERARVEAEWSDTREEIQAALRVAFRGLVDHAVERLGVEDGKPRKFKNSMIDKMNEFLSTFDARNLTDDAELRRLTEQARSLINDVDVKKLRQDIGVRADFRAAFERIKSQMDTMVTPRGRRFSLAEEV
jgi:hypothetical protein